MPANMRRRPGLMLRAFIALSTVLLFALISTPCAFSQSFDDLPDSIIYELGIDTGMIRGLDAIEQKLADRVVRYKLFYAVFNSGDTFPLRRMMGDFDERGQYQNGKPNSVNVTLWTLYFDFMHKEARRLCASDGEESPIFRTDFAETMRRLCQQDLSLERRREALESTWFAVMAYDGDYEDFVSFLDFFMADAFWELAPDERPAAALRALVESPAFFLQQ